MWWQQDISLSPSAEYRIWQNQFLAKRLRLCLWLALICHLSFAVINLASLVWLSFPEILRDRIIILGDIATYERLERWKIISDWVSITALIGCLIVRKRSWGQRHPRLIFLVMSWSMALLPQILGTAMGFPIPTSWDFIFMAQVILIPIHWRLHLLAQSVTVLYYFIVNPLLGLNQLPGTTGLFSLENVTHALLIYLISNIAAFLYDRLQQREFESRRELRLFIHAVTHDLRIPVMGTSIVLQNLLRKAQATDGQATITAPKLEQLLDGSNRQINLINSILEAHTSETQGMTLHCQPLQLSTLVSSVLVDTDALLHQNQIQLNNRITDDLPLIQADGNHLCRVFNNLITNALTHNPSGIQLTLGATLLKSKMLYCTIQDTGIGIPLQQQSRLFEIYYRGEQSRYMPGLGLGLYLCHQIITAHGGKIGVISQPGKGATFWFTLPVVADKGRQAMIEELSLDQTRSEGNYRSLHPVIY